MSSFFIFRQNIKMAFATWSFAPMNEENVAEFLYKIELRDMGKEEIHIKQVKYFSKSIN